jgi:NADH-quinone oxidoreductase subunit L
MGDYLFLIPLFPLIGVIINGILLRKAPEKLVGFVGCSAVFGSFVVAALSFAELIGTEAGERVPGLMNVVYQWISVGDLQIPMGFQFDPLSAVMALIVSGVGFLIHVYSVSYMHGEFGFRRYFTYLNLFIMSMFLLVLGNNMVVMFVGWEGVGLCSYLLIGYYYEKKSASDAGKKAFIVNRIGDFGFLIGIFMVYYFLGTVEFAPMKAATLGLEHTQANTFMFTLITLALFVGAAGKSAQIPLYVWLPDAMEGPTPVSALIHAATMVTAGVYMVARLHFMYLQAPISMGVVATIGALTALYAATIAMTQNDIKRVLAYSTISQLGYMFLAVGVGAYAAGVFHLMTHAFFKACLFLGAGAIMHALSGELDMRKMGGLKKELPVTFWTFLVATLAIAGIPGLSGFFSKDEILWKAFSSANGSPLLWAIGFLTAAMTAFYMGRALFMTFLGERRDKTIHVHKESKLINVVLITLAFLALVGGYIGIPAALGGANHFEHWLAPVFEMTATGGHAIEGVAAAAHGEVAAAAHGAGAHHNPMEYVLMFLSIGAAFFGLFAAWFLYIKKPGLPKLITDKIKPIYQLVYNKYFVDEINDALIVGPTKVISEHLLWKTVDEKVIDGTVNGVAQTAKGIAQIMRRLQTGLVTNYALWIVIGTVAIIGYLLY